MTFGELIARIEKLEAKVARLEKSYRPRFTPPTEEEVREYARDVRDRLGPRYRLAESYVEGFVLHYGMKGWMVGKTAMKDWRMAFRRAVIEWEPPKQVEQQQRRKAGAYRTFDETGLGYE